MKTEELTLKNGKFMRNGIEVPPEFGNTEQIALLKKEDKRLEDMEKNGIPVDFKAHSGTISASMTFSCICGNRIQEKADITIYDCDDVYAEVQEHFAEEGWWCPRCNRDFKIKNGKAKILKP